MSRRMYRHTRRPPSRVIKGESRTYKLLEQNRIRLASIMVCFAFSFVALGLRLAEVSLVGGGDLPFKRLVSEPQLMLQRDDAQGHEVQAQAVVSHRQNIVDRNGIVLATNVQTASLAANPSLMSNPKQVAVSLSKILHDVPLDVLTKKLDRPNATFVYIKRNLTPKEQQHVNELGVPGLFFEQHDRRVYPFGDMLSHVLGYVDIDNHGIAGIEKFFDKRLELGLKDDDSLTLSIDARIQSILHQELEAGKKTYSAIGAVGVVMDIKSGEILAMSSLPSYDPNHLEKATADEMFNRATLGAYEMGSTFKTFTVAMALNEKVVTMDGGYDASHPIQAAGFTINDSHPLYRWLSVPEIYAYSSNIGTVRMIMDVGMERQQKYLKKLGMMEKVSIELPEKVQPLVPHEWRPINSMTISYGHGMSVSPLHLVQGIATVVGGGKKARMTLLKGGNKKQEMPRIISEETSRHVRELMRGVVEYGTAKKANVVGYQVGGKTGTAEKVSGGRYKEKAMLSSLVSAFPMDDPKYIIYIMLDEPQGTKETYGFATGGWVAAPVVANVVSRMGVLLGMQPVKRPPDPQQMRYWVEAERRNVEARERRDQARLIHATSY